MMQWDWKTFLGRPEAAPDNSLVISAVRGKSILITGAGGSIGSRIALAALHGSPEKLLLLDTSEHSLYELSRRIAAQPGIRRIYIVPIIGSVTDRRLLQHVFQEHRPGLVFHAAAYKHVPLMEENPFAAIENNAIGTYRLVLGALEHGPCDVVLVSTDKAVNPTSIMGASKRTAELAVLSQSNSVANMFVVRLGNVLGSSGSVVPLFEEQLQLAIPLTVTHPDARRYFLTADEAAAALLLAASASSAGKILVPDCGEPLSVLGLAKFMLDSYLKFNASIALRPTHIRFIGLRPGEKLVEESYLASEQIEETLASGLRVFTTPCLLASEVALGMQRMEAAIARFDLQAMLAAIAEIVPEYRPAERFQSEILVAEAR